jgi:hypothetical protein
MKNAKFEVEFTRHVLANASHGTEERDKFPRDSQRRLIFHHTWFYAAFEQAIKLARVRGIKPADIHMDLVVTAPTELYNRKYGRDKFREHEAIMPGTRVTFEAVVADHVTQSNLTEILDKMGRFVGLSPSGYNLGYGRFILKKVEVTPDADKRDTEQLGSDQRTQGQVAQTG